MMRVMTVLALTIFGLAATVTARADTLAEIRARGELVCGVSTGLYGFSDKSADGRWSGFDVDFCRALAAAVLSDPGKVRYVALNASERFEALRGRSVDLLSRNTTWTLQREAELGLAFGGVNFYDGQGFMVRRGSGLTSALELDGRSVCVQSGTTSEATAADYFAENSIKAAVKTYPDSQTALAAFAAGACDALTTDNSGLFAERLKLEKPAEHVVLPDIISKEPLGPVTRADDPRWSMIVRWVNFALINAEEIGVSSKTLDAARASSKPEVRRFTGADGGFGKMLGLGDDWALRAVSAGGNYAEIYERNVGTNSRLGIPRGLNQLWTMGGILYAPPMR